MVYATKIAAARSEAGERTSDLAQDEKPLCRPSSRRQGCFGHNRRFHQHGRRDRQKPSGDQIRFPRCRAEPMVWRSWVNACGWRKRVVVHIPDRQVGASQRHGPASAACPRRCAKEAPDSKCAADRRSRLPKWTDFLGDGLGGGPPTAHAQWASGGFRSAGCGASLIGALFRAHEAGIGHFALQPSQVLLDLRVSRAAAWAARAWAGGDSGVRRATLFCACAGLFGPRTARCGSGSFPGESRCGCIRSR